jgi:hypothetical protein
VSVGCRSPHLPCSQADCRIRWYYVVAFDPAAIRSRCVPAEPLNWFLNKPKLTNDPGDPEKLRRAGVKPIVDLPGVVLNFHDHYLTFSVFRAKPGTESFDDFARGDPEVQKRMFS